MMTAKFRPLINLKHLAFSTKLDNGAATNERLPFDRIQLFIDQCHLKTSILRKVTLKFDYIVFNENLWSAIVRYKNTFDRFDFYASFIADDRASIIRIIPSNNDHFDYHIEDGDPLHPQARFVHIYSLPFAFDKLHGFISCSELSFRSSFLSVRHLYLTRTRLACPISFELLTRRMPNLISIDCNFSFAHGHNKKVSQLIFDQDIFKYVRFFRFISYCSSKHCDCCTLISQLIDRMPRLQCLITSVDPFEYAQHPLPSIKRLDYRQWDFKSIYRLPEYIPHLLTLFFYYTISSVRELSDIISSLYMRIPSLKLISIKVRQTNCSNGVSIEKIAQQALVRMQNKNNRLHHLTLNCTDRVAEFFLQNM
ncbi:unnamed protein product [Adineta steineri]|uniref:F-box domain-containing protein n=1 Tax=Adineta steineri TaxID=433720 RepID=A0A815RVB7_9BILA|nr:unnamed protein product [Adineta steineri]